jgi:hypothetical protein
MKITWIDFKDEFPPECSLMWIYAAGEITLGRYHSGDFDSEGYFEDVHEVFHSLSNVTAWAPLDRPTNKPKLKG